MVRESGRRCQQAIRDWWQSLKGIETITAAREGQWATGNSTWERPQRQARGSIRDLDESLSTKATACCGRALPTNRCAETPVPWNHSVTAESISDPTCKHVTPPPTSKEGV